MVRDKRILIILILTIFVKKSFALTADDYIYCNTGKYIAVGQSLYIYFSETGSTQKACEYLVKSPTDSYIAVEVYHDLTGSGTSCTTQYVQISPDGDPRYRTGAKYCGLRDYYNPLKFNSIGNEVRFRVVSDDLKRVVQIKMTAWPITASNCSCSWNPSTRVANGQSTASTTFIGNAVLKTMINKFYEAICGATIISYKYSITAAHCVNYANSFGIANVMLHVGRQNVTADVYADTVYSEQYAIEVAVKHPNYDENNNLNDIGYIKTTRDIRYSRGVGPACISFPYQTYAIPDGSTLTAIGFGATEYSAGASIDQKSWILQNVKLTVKKNLDPVCTQLPKVCCQGDIVANGGRGDTCQRDSGGGIYGYINNLYYFMAITSEGYVCGTQSSFSINVHVSNYIPWFKTFMGSELLCNK